MTEALGPAALADRVRALSRPALAAVVVVALAVGTYAAWLGGDYGLGPGSVVGFGLMAAYLLVQQPSARAVVARGLYLLAGLVLVTPVFLNLPLVTATMPGLARPVRTVLHPGVLVFALVFVVGAAVLAAAGYGLDRR